MAFKIEEHIQKEDAYMRKYRVGDIVWVNFESLKGCYVGPAKITYDEYDNHYWIRLPIMLHDENVFFIEKRKVETLITEGEEDGKEKEGVVKREEASEND